MIESLRDRRDQLFGRDADIRKLLDRVAKPGLTAVVARPMMGKTWTLTEVARQCQEQRVLVGYHESKGPQSNHLLYAVADLYARWLSDSSMREQAISLWRRHEEGLVPRVGKMVAALFEKLGGSLIPDQVAELVRHAFDGLAVVQTDLLNGGLQLAPLPYDQALSLTKLVAGVSGRRIVLILDAWEKSASGQSEHATLEAFLKHLDEWPDSHVIVAIRHPELPTDQKSEARQLAINLCNISAAAYLYELHEMDLSTATEFGRLKNWMQQLVPATKHVPDDQLMAMIDSYPGVVSFWSSQANKSAMRTTADLQRVAQNAQAGRYTELDQLMKAMPDARRTVAARLAFLPRLDEERWEALQELVLDGQGTEEINALIDSAVLSEESIPTFGHDTRHAAARKWFLDKHAPMIRRLGKGMIKDLATRISDIDDESVVYLEELVACEASASDIGINSDVGYLINAARCAFGSVEKTLDSAFDAQYSAGVAREPALTPLIAIALRNRGISKRESGDNAGAIADYTKVIELPGKTGKQVAQALINRGAAKAQNQDYIGAIADFTEAILRPELTNEDAARAWFNRGVAKGLIGDELGASADYTEVIERPNAPPAQVGKALFNRAAMREQDGDNTGALADYTKIIQLPGAPSELVHAVLNAIRELTDEA